MHSFHCFGNNLNSDSEISRGIVRFYASSVDWLRDFLPVACPMNDWLQWSQISCLNLHLITKHLFIILERSARVSHSFVFWRMLFIFWHTILGHTGLLQVLRFSALLRLFWWLPISGIESGCVTRVQLAWFLLLWFLVSTQSVGSETRGLFFDCSTQLFQVNLAQAVCQLRARDCPMNWLLMYSCSPWWSSVDEWVSKWSSGFRSSCLRLA